MCRIALIYGMTPMKMDHVTVVVEDLPAAIAFFKKLGMNLEGEASVEGEWVDRLCGLKDTKADIAMMRMPDGNGGIELTKYNSPALIEGKPGNDLPNVAGLRQIMFQVDDLEGAVTNLCAEGASLIGEIVEYEGVYKLCYLRGPEGMIVALAEELTPH